MNAMFRASHDMCDNSCESNVVEHQYGFIKKSMLSNMCTSESNYIHVCTSTGCASVDD